MREMDEAYKKLIESYLPGWKYDPDSGQPEAALLYAAWRLLEDTRCRIQCLPQKHEREFLKAWAVSSQSAQQMQAEPMQTYAVLHSPEGEKLNMGSEVYLSGSGTRLWKTIHPAAAENMYLKKQILESAALGKILDISLPTETVASRIFDYRHRGDQKNTVRFSHPYVFRTKNGGRAELCFPECEAELLNRMADERKTQWFLVDDKETFLPLKKPEVSQRKLIFTFPALDAVALEASFEPGEPVPTQILGRVFVEVLRPVQSCRKILADQEQVQTETFQPFGLKPELWKCCYLSAPDVLNLRGAQVQMDFQLSLEIREEQLPIPPKKPRYGNIMFRMPPPPPEPREIRAQEVIWEYWDGTAWQPVPDGMHQIHMFASGEKAHRVSVHFHWPENAQPCEIQGMEEIWIRWRITKVDNMGYLPQRIYTPQVHGLQLQSVLKTDRVKVTVTEGITPGFRSLTQEKNTRLFSHPVSMEDGWWLCFDRPPREQQLCLYLEMDGRVAPSSFTVWEATYAGLKQRGITDGTEGLSHSGMLVLADLQGQMTEQFGQRGWWICIRDHDNYFRRKGFYPRVTHLFCGSVILQAEQDDDCQVGESVRPLRGGAVTGKTLTQGFGGTQKETDSEMLLRVERARHHLNRGVSALDVQQLLQAEFRDVVRTRCRQNGRKMEIAVLLRDIHQHSAAFARRREQMLRLLEKKTVFSIMGMELCLQEANFYPVQVAVWLQSDPDDNFQESREQVKQVLNRFLHPVTGRFSGDGWHIGDLPTEQEVNNSLGMELPQIRLLKVLLSTVTPEGEEVECSRIQDSFALPVAGKIIVYEAEGEDVK